MKALLLCAGLGTRLRPLTDTIPKPMLEVAGEPLLVRSLRSLHAAGVSDVAINLHHLPDVITERIGTTFEGMRIVYAHEQTLRGSAGAIRGFDGFFDESFFVVYGDVYFETDLAEVTAFHFSRQSLLTMVVQEMINPIDKGIVVADPASGAVLGFVEKPEIPPAQALINTGIYLCEPQVAALIPPGVSDFGRDLIPYLIATRQPVYALSCPGVVVDIGTPAGLQKARARATELR